MPRPTLPDSLPGVLQELDRSRSYSAAGVAIMELGDPSGPPEITGLTLTTQVETDVHGRDTASVLAVWDPVPVPTGEDVDVRRATVRDYVVQYRNEGSSDFGPRSFVEANAFRVSGLPVGRLFRVRVAARTVSGTIGPAVEAEILTAADTIPPDKPSTPTLRTSGFLKAIEVGWDGLLGGSAALPADLRHLEVWIGTVSPPSSDPANLRGSMDKSERTFSYPTPNYEPHYAQLRAVDTSGNTSAFSDVSLPASGEQVVSDDLHDEIVINARAQGTFGGGNGVLNSSFESKADNGTTPDPFRLWTQKVNATSIATSPFHKATAARLTRSGGAVALLASNRIAVSETGEKIVTAWVRLNTAGLTPRVDAYNPDGGTQPTLAETQPVEYALDPNLVGEWQRIGTAYSASAKGDLVARVVLDSGPDGTVDVDAVQYELGSYATAYAPNVGELTPGSIGATEIAKDSVTSEKIVAGAVVAGKVQADAIGANEIRAGSITAAKGHLEDAVIVRAKIRDLAVDTAKIADAAITSLKVLEMTAERITTGTLRASTRIIAGVAGGNRIEIDYDGIRLISTANGYDQVMISLDRATGSGRFTGTIDASVISGSTLRTGYPGSTDYIELSTSARDLISFYKQGSGLVGQVIGTNQPGITLSGQSRANVTAPVVQIGTNGGRVEQIAPQRRNSFLDPIRVATVQAASNSNGTVDISFANTASNAMQAAPTDVQANIRFTGSPGTSGPGNGAVFVNTGEFTSNGFRLYVMRGSDGQPVSTTRVFAYRAERFV